ncbi:MAG: hypothetical protein JRN51_06885 [Nitrososphaerota archaeon]|jgi:Arc/MetJ-type ribon-helix-helix transcriptional regulator|nr:ribbon-helix-helix domain-containing protein [Ferrimicrobium acidiphilum]MDG6980824.1 hypothetical protein [Nitrososphaerota archaeon]
MPQLTVLDLSAATMVKRYRNVSIPEDLYAKLEKLVESEKAGYVSVSDAVKDTSRELLRKHKLLP